jgi:hypothetical protein
MTKRTFEERVLFDYGFKRGQKYGVVLTKEGVQVRHAVVYLPTRGRPRLVIKTHLHANVYAVNTSIIDKDDLVYLGHSTKPADIDEFNTLIADPDNIRIQF